MYSADTNVWATNNETKITIFNILTLKRITIVNCVTTREAATNIMTNPNKSRFHIFICVKLKIIIIDDYLFIYPNHINLYWSKYHYIILY